MGARSLLASTGYKEHSQILERATWVEEWRCLHRRCSRWQRFSNKFNGLCCHLPNREEATLIAPKSLYEGPEDGEGRQVVWHTTLCRRTTLFINACKCRLWAIMVGASSIASATVRFQFQLQFPLRFWAQAQPQLSSCSSSSLRLIINNVSRLLVDNQSAFFSVLFA